MTATNMCSNFGGFRCSPPLRFWSSTDSTHFTVGTSFIALKIDLCVLSFDSKKRCSDITIPMLHVAKHWLQYRKTSYVS